MDTKKTVIVGSGLSALLMARMIKLYRNPEADIVIVEKEPNIGGQFGSFNYGKYGYFDMGMHIYYESSIPEIDELITKIMPDEEWNILENNYKDIAGLFFNGKLQEGTAYVDLRNFPEEKWKKFVAEIFHAIRSNKDKKLHSGTNAYESLTNHFGQSVVDEVFVPILEKFYLTHPRNLDNVATHLTTVNRVALFEPEIMNDLMKSDEIRARICYPEQMSLPPYRNNPQRGFYPKKYGMILVLEKLKSLLISEGVQFLTSSVVSEAEVKDNEVTAVTITTNNNNSQIFPVREIFWSAGLPSLASSLKVDCSDLVYDKKQTEGLYVNFFFDKLPQMGKLYYFYSFDKGFRTYRVTNYTNYCPAAAEHGYPLCVEFWALPGDAKDEDSILAMAKGELKSYGVIDDTYKVTFSKVEKPAGGGFPLPSVRNISNMLTIKQRIEERGFKNVIPTGVLSDKNVFFIKDVLIDTYKKVTKNRT